MFKIQIGGITCNISLLFPVVLLLLLIEDRAGIAFHSLLAAVLHECGHLLMLCVFGKSQATLSLSFYGMRLSTATLQSLETWRQIVVYAAGPMVNIVCCLLLVVIKNPLLGLIHVMLATANLLPIEPLDGGQIWRCFLTKTVGIGKVDKWASLTSCVIWGLLMIVGVGLWWCTQYNFTLLIMGIYIGFCMLFDKGN